MAFGDGLVKRISADFSIWQIYVARSVFAIPLIVALLGTRVRPAPILPRSIAWSSLRSALLVAKWIAFYAALHLVDRLAARINFHPTPPGAHANRLRFVSSSHRVIFADYNDLKVASEIARYGTLHQFNRAFPATTVQDILIDQRLVAIENYVNNIFNPSAPPPAATGS